MLTYQAITLGIIQGLTEFIPVSSTAHLTLAGRLMGLVKPDQRDSSQEWTAFMAVIQMGTLLAAVIYFLPDIVHIISGVGANLAFRAKQDAGQPQNYWARLGWLLIAGSLPIGAAGLAFRNRIEGRLTKSLWVIVGAMLAVAVLLGIAEAAGSRSRGISDLGFADSIAVGMSQVFALVPGASRSGATIGTGLLMGLNREAAARFSFLLMIPAVGASGLFKLPAALRSTNAGITQLLAGILGAGVSGYLAIGFMLGFLQTHSVYPFVVYRVILGALMSWLLLSRRLDND